MDVRRFGVRLGILVLVFQIEELYIVGLCDLEVLVCWLLFLIYFIEFLRVNQFGYLIFFVWGKSKEVFLGSNFLVNFRYDQVDFIELRLNGFFDM